MKRNKRATLLVTMHGDTYSVAYGEAETLHEWVSRCKDMDFELEVERRLSQSLIDNLFKLADELNTLDVRHEPYAPLCLSDWRAEIVRTVCSERRPKKVKSVPSHEGWLAVYPTQELAEAASDEGGVASGVRRREVHG